MSGLQPRGRFWEQTAESFLNNNGLKTLNRNYRCRLGEIDLVMLDRNTLVFTEVRYRGNDGYGSGAESVNLGKQRRIIRVAQSYLQQHSQHPLIACRFDVVSIGRKNGKTELNWIRNAFQAN